MPAPTMVPAALNRRPEAVEDRTGEAMIERVWVCSTGDSAVGNDRDRAGYRSYRTLSTTNQG
jgi:hypothetical protein